MVAVAVADAFAWLVAVTVTACCVVTVAGAVYNPVALTLPAPDSVHVTAVLLAFTTVALSCCVCPP